MNHSYEVPNTEPNEPHLYDPTDANSLHSLSGPSPQCSPFLKASDSLSSDSPYSTKEDYPELPIPPWRPRWRRPFVLALASLLCLATITALVVSLAVTKRHHSHYDPGQQGDHSSGISDGGSDATVSTTAAFQTGGDGSIVTKSDGTSFVYNNTFGGFWVSNPSNSFDNSARPNSWTPRLNETWNWGTDRINGVNLGGLFVLEPFITPALFQAHPTAVDEWTLSTALSQDGGNALRETLEHHYDTFITEEDIAQIAGAGLNWIRLPIPFWAVETWADVGVDAKGQTVAEPFLARTCWKYILRVLEWARKYGIRVMLDLHTAPGSQNGFNHSGKLGNVNWLNGVMGVANAERSLDYIRAIAEFISQPQYKDLIPVFGILNEPFSPTVGKAQLRYSRAYEMLRNVTGIGAGNGPIIAIHDGFSGPADWASFLPGADRLALDYHPYFAFSGSPNREPVNITAVGGDGTELGGKWPNQACSAWADTMDASRKAFGITIAGEFSNAINDCGLYVHGVNISAAYGPDCTYWEDASRWSDATRAGLLAFARASMDALGDWFFWTWKVGPAAGSTGEGEGAVRAPLWSYSLGLEGGWIPRDPRDARGACESFGAAPSHPFDGAYALTQTGSGPAMAVETHDVLAWPPALLHVSGAQAALPRYTRTAAPLVLPGPTAGAGDGATTAGAGAGSGSIGKAFAPIEGCAYPDAWDALGAKVPVGGCT